MNWLVGTLADLGIALGGAIFMLLVALVTLRLLVRSQRWSPW